MKRSLKPIDSLPIWAKENGIILNGVTLAISPSGYGTGLVTTSRHSKPGSLFIQVPSHLLFSKGRVWELAQEDEDLAQILAANGEFTQTTRGTILIFLLMQIAHTSPDLLESGSERLPIGKPGPFAEYVQYIQTETSLPTFWSGEDTDHFWGTSLERHHAAKMRSLATEFEQFKASCKDLHWAEIWLGGEERGCLTFQDWLTVDAMWRSRAMDLSGEAGDDCRECLVPVMDMANHTPDGIAAYELAVDGNGKKCAELRLDMDLAPTLTHQGGLMPYQGANVVRKGSEITISYGNIKGAAEMIFSYGFLDHNLPDARSMMLGWKLPEDDPLRFEKVAALDLEPGIQIYTPGGAESSEVCFAGAAVWAMSINEEDGLKIVRNTEPPSSSFQQNDDCNDPVLPLQTPSDEDNNNESTSYNLFFKGTLITSKSHLLDILKHDRAALVFRTRAYAYVLMRVEEELSRLASSHPSTDEDDSTNAEDEKEGSSASSRARICQQLRHLEITLLSKAAEYFSAQISTLIEHPDVVNYSILLEQGLTLPELSDAEQWARFEDEHDERNRVGYVSALEEKLERLATTGGREVNGV